MTTLKALLEQATVRLVRAEVPDAEVDAAWLLADLLHCSRNELELKQSEQATDSITKAYEKRIYRRSKREPLQHILGYESFLGLRLKVDRRALIPRPETEGLVEQLLELNLPREARVLDIGTGTCCIPIACARSNTHWTFTAVDASQDAIKLARENIGRHRLANRIQLKTADLYTWQDWLLPEAFDLVVSNPPYVSESEWSQCAPEVRDYEPALALKAGPQGLDPFPDIFKASQAGLKPGGWLALEFGSDQALEILGMGEMHNFKQQRVVKDIFGRDRYYLGQRGTK